jgi:hypothetical protein
MLKGGKALAPKEFAARKPEALIGASVLVVVPTGQYDPQRLVNPGTNRWAFKPEIGISKPINRWTFEAMGGAWFFMASPDVGVGQRNVLHGWQHRPKRNVE